MGIEGERGFQSLFVRFRGDQRGESMQTGSSAMDSVV